MEQNTNPQSDAIEAAAKAMWRRHMQIVWEGGEAPICEWDELPRSQRASQRDVMSSALTAYHKWLEASGWAVVPVEATGEMIEAARKMDMPRADNAQAMVSAMLVGTWAAMIAARPRVEG